MNNKTSKFFSDYSEKFDSLYGSNHGFIQLMVNKLFRKSMLLRFDKTMEYCQPIVGRTILDIGCGPGHYCIALAQLGAIEANGIDFSPKMIQLATDKARSARLDDRCRFEVKDFFELDEYNKYDYTIVMGFMDYVSNPLDVIKKVTEITKCKALFSFPIANGILAWQRKLRYKNRCSLFLYYKSQLCSLFGGIKGWSFRIEKIARDYFVIIERDSNETI